jgi:pantoate--beta-alanine ligase
MPGARSECIAFFNKRIIEILSIFAGIFLNLLVYRYFSELRTISEVKELTGLLSDERASGRSVGLVPTMGALHKGHVSLVECCAAGNDVTVVSIFVNPDQFNDPEDLEKYPRTLDADLNILEEAGCTVAFVPSVHAMYPGPDRRVFDFGILDKVMEGHYRPGHFNGVARAVSRLFEMVGPDRAYFGEKDFQQLAVIREMTRMLKLPVEIIACPTVREDDGLAMSSRNMLLDPEQRKNAALINQTLRQASLKRGQKVGEIRQWVTSTINENPYLGLQYFEIVDPVSLQPASDDGQISGPLIGCIAVHAGKVRLIDNVFFYNFAVL